MSETMRNRIRFGGKEIMLYAGNSTPSELGGSLESRSRVFGRHWWATRQKLTPPISICEISLDFDVVSWATHAKAPFHHEPYENTAIAKDKEPLEAFTATAAQTAEQMTKQTQGVMENYFGWLQKTMSTFPWSNTNLNRILLSNATQNVTAAFAFVQKLSKAKNFEEVVKIQTEFMEAQMNSFNKQAKVLGELLPKQRKM